MMFDIDETRNRYRHHHHHHHRNPMRKRRRPPPSSAGCRLAQSVALPPISPSPAPCTELLQEPYTTQRNIKKVISVSCTVLHHHKQTKPRRYLHHHCYRPYVDTKAHWFGKIPYYLFVAAVTWLSLYNDGWNGFSGAWTATVHKNDRRCCRHDRSYNALLPILMAASGESLSRSSHTRRQTTAFVHQHHHRHEHHRQPPNKQHSTTPLQSSSLPSSTTSSFSTFSSSSSSSSSSNHFSSSSSFSISNITTATKVQPKKKSASTKDHICSLFREAKTYEKMGQWSLAIQNYEYILETLNPHDAHSYLALAKLQTKRQQYTTAQTIYQNGIVACPTSIHLLQAYAIYEETITHNTTKAQQLYEQALHIDSYNPYVCHAYSCMERKMGNLHHATSLLQQALRYSTTAAVVCTLGELYIAQQQYDQTRLLYEEHIPKIIHKNQNNHRNGKRQDAVRELMEVYLAYAWLEERYYNNHIRAEQLLHTALQLCPTSNVIQIALARFDGRRRPQSQTLTATTTGSTTAMGTGKGVLSTLPNPSYQLSSVPVSTDTKLLATKSITSSSVLLSTTSSISMRSTINNPTFVEQKQQHVPYHHHPSSKRVRNSASIRRLASACMKFEQQKQEQDDIGKSAMTATTSVPSSSSSLSSKSYIDIPSDGRLYNAWANMEVKAKRYQEARKILYRGLLHFPYDHTLLQATGRVEERLGNYSGAQYYYGASLQIQPSAPTLVAYALLNLKNHNFGAPSDVVSKGVMDDNGNKTNGNSSINLMAPKLNMNETKQLFEEALMIDRRHGPAYNAYARTVMEYDNDVHLARTIYERGIRANCTDMASIYHGYARLELSLGNVEVARNILIEGQHEVNRINIGTDSPHRDRAVFLTHTLGMLELNHHRPNHAYDVFLDGIDRYGNSSQLLLGTALSLVKLGKERQARDYFEQAVTTDERHAQAWQAWGMMEMRGGNYKTAKVLLECGIRNTPRYGPLWHAYGLLESRMGNIEMARTLFEKGIEVAPNHVGLYQSWATLELREENYNVAKDLIAEALTRDKHNGVGWMIAADIEQQMGNDGLSLLVLRRGIECSESSNNNHNKVRLYRALGDTLVRLGKIVEARQVLEEGISIDPFYAPLYHSLAELEARVGNVEELARLNKRTASIFNTNALLQATSKSNDTYHRAVMNSQSVFLQNNPSSDVLQNVAALSKRIGPEEEKKVGNISPNRLPNESSIFLDNLMNSYCLDDDGICDLIRGEPNDQEVDER